MDLALLAQLPKHELAAHLADLEEDQLHLIKWMIRWRMQARDKQIAPRSLPNGGKWFIWYITSGRGFGKTLTGANWLGLKAAQDPDSINFVIAPTSSDLVGTCFEGPTGLMNVIPTELIYKDGYIKSGEMAPIIYLKNGAYIRGFSAEKPDRLRGPQCHRVWCEEISSWQRGTACWDMMIFGLRLGNDTQALATSTPKPVPLVKKIITHPKAVITRGSTYENKDNLSAEFLEEILKYEGTRLGRQEIHGELLDPEEMGVIKRSWIRLWPADKPLPEFFYIIISLDTAYTEKSIDKETGDPDFSACGVWGLFYEKTLETKRGVVTKRRGLPAIMMLNAWQDRLGLPDLITKVKEELKKGYGPPSKPMVATPFGPSLMDSDGRKPDLLLIEDKGSGISLRQMLETDGIVAHPFNPGRADKYARLNEVAPVFARGRVWTVESARNRGQLRKWAEPVVEQLCTYGGEGSIEHDDHVDQTTQVLRVAVHHRLLRVIDEKKAIEELEKEAESQLTGIPVEQLNGHALPPPTATPVRPNPYLS
jgi:predicted phage terminase large subunit-like protein